MAQAIPEMKTSGFDWDTDPYLIGTQDAVVNLKTGKAIKTSPKVMVTCSLATKFDPAARCDLWTKTIESFWPNQPDMARFIQKAVGYAFTGDIKEQVLFCLFGAGSNGKSVFQNTLVRLAGDYGYVAPFSTLEFHERGGISNDVAILQGKRFVVASETQENIRLNEGRIKSLTGDSHITARFLYQEPFTFRPVAKFWLGFNHKPKVVDDSHGFWRRIRLLTFDRVFTDAEQDKDLETKLVAEFPGILNWIIEGCQMWLTEGLQPSTAVIKDTEDYKKESNPLTDFIDDCCIPCDTGIVTNSDIWEEYCLWVRRSGERFQLGRKGFSQRMESLGYIQIKHGQASVRAWKGLKIGKMKIEVGDVQASIH
jgi:putative DNA primase/helicase